MLATFLSITPIFLVMAVGVGLRRTPIFEDGFWTGLDRMGFYVLYPVLLFATILKADFGGLALGTVLFSALGGLAILAVGTLALWPLLRTRGVSGPTFSTIFQSAVRWNGFIALAIAEKLFPPEGAAMVAVLMAAVVIPINVASVSAVAVFGDGKGRSRGLGLTILLNPIILSVAAALILRALPFSLPMVVTDAVHLLSRAALGMGLLAIGAGLRVEELTRPRPVLLLPVGLKLLLYPLLVWGLAVAVGMPVEQLPWLVLCASVPTAMNGYVVARQMGGDAPAYAVVATLQTAIAFVSIPALQQLVGLLSG